MGINLVRREANKYAHWIAQNGKRKMLPAVWDIVIPSSLLNLIWNEAVNVDSDEGSVSDVPIYGYS